MFPSNHIVRAFAVLELCEAIHTRVLCLVYDDEEKDGHCQRGRHLTLIALGLFLTIIEPYSSLSDEERGEKFVRDVCSGEKSVPMMIGGEHNYQICQCLSLLGEFGLHIGCHRHSNSVLRIADKCLDFTIQVWTAQLPLMRFELGRDLRTKANVLSVNTYDNFPQAIECLAR